MATKKTESNLFADIALRWFKSKQHRIDEKTHIKKLRRFELHVFPIIGHLGIGDVKSPDVFDVVRPLIERLKLDTARRLRAEISEIYGYAIAHGYTEYDPAH